MLTCLVHLSYIYAYLSSHAFFSLSNWALSAAKSFYFLLKVNSACLVLAANRDSGLSLGFSAM